MREVTVFESRRRSKMDVEAEVDALVRECRRLGTMEDRGVVVKFGLLVRDELFLEGHRHDDDADLDLVRALRLGPDPRAEAAPSRVSRTRGPRCALSCPPAGSGPGRRSPPRPGRRE